MLEAFNQGAKQVSICLFEGENAWNGRVWMETRAKRQVHQYGNYDLQTEVEVEEFVSEDGLEHLEDQVVQLDIAWHRLCGRIHQCLAL